jgi:hypothetical protein
MPCARAGEPARERSGRGRASRRRASAPRRCGFANTSVTARGTPPTIWARYTAGQIGERAVPACVDEEGVDPSRGTETFAEVVRSIDTPRWHGVPFVLRAGTAWLPGAKSRRPPSRRRRVEQPSRRHRRTVGSRWSLPARMRSAWSARRPPRTCRRMAPCYSSCWRAAVGCRCVAMKPRKPGGSSSRSSRPGASAARRSRCTPPDRPGRRGSQRRRIRGASDSDPAHGREPRVGGVATGAAG